MLVLDHRSGHGKTSGLEIGQMSTDAANLFHVCGKEVCRLVLYLPASRPEGSQALSRDRYPGELPANLDLVRSVHRASRFAWAEATSE